jgi:putative ABC transport system ATP-binding protein
MSAAEAGGLPLTVANLRVRGDGGRLILQIDGLAVRPGECVGIRGPSGAGKSTLLFALAGLAAQAEGSLRWGVTEFLALGQDARAAFRRAHMGLVFQDFLLFEELSAAANAALAGAYAPRAARPQLARRAQATLARLGLATGERRTVESFSGGERQRVAVARALANDPAIILADEPTASLDRAAADRLIDDLVALAHEGGKTLITVSHDPALHARMDRLVTIADGRLVDLMRTRGTRGNA